MGLEKLFYRYSFFKSLVCTETLFPENAVSHKVAPVYKNIEEIQGKKK
jgi:hypothetical protein